MFSRLVRTKIETALSDTPVVFLQGARQVGKTTLARQIAGEAGDYAYLTLDSAATLAAASADPDGFVAGLTGKTILDEVQRVPELALAIKRSVDSDRLPGRFLLTGSAGALNVPALADSLAGRMELITLWPLSQVELIKSSPLSFVDKCFAPGCPEEGARPLKAGKLEELLVTGTYPEPISRKTQERRSDWFESYLTTIIQRDIRDLANIENIANMPRLLHLLALRSARLLNYADLARDAGLPQTTAKRYVALLQAVFLMQLLPAWYTNRSKRLIKSPRIVMVDSGLACHLAGISADGLAQNRQLLGHFLENFVAMELLKQLGWSRTRATLYHFRTSANHEVDLVVEDRQGRIVGIEVKAAATVRSEDIRGMKVLADVAGPAFHRGIVLYSGSDTIPFAKNIHALPLTTLWA